MSKVSTRAIENQTVTYDRAVRAIAHSNLPDNQRALLATILNIGQDHAGTLRFVISMATSASSTNALAEPNNPNITLSEWLKTWIARYTGRTGEGYWSICRNHIIPKLGNLLLYEVKASHIRSLIDGCNKSPTTKAHIYACLRTALECAVQEELIDTNPATRVHVPLKYTPRFSPLNWQEIRTLIAAKDIPNYTLIVTAVTTGMRQGELLALRWRNVDFDKRVIHVNESLGKDGKTKEVKNRENRSIKLLRLTLNTLRNHKEKTYQGNLDGLVFCREAGSPLRADGVTRTFQRNLNDLGIHKMRFHDLRHTHATILLNDGWPLKAVQERLGHKSAKMTLDLYGHFVPGLQEHLVEQMEKSGGFSLETDDLTESLPKASGRIRTDDLRFTKPLLYP